MKKHLYVILSAACLAAGLSACGKEEKTKSAPEEEETAVTPAVQEEKDIPHTLPGLENGMLKITASTEDGKKKKKVRIQDDSLHIQYLPLTGKAPTLPGNECMNRSKRKWDIISSRSSRSLAASLLPLRKNYILWAPKQNVDTRQVMIPDIRLSRDQSILALVENYGKKGAQGSRIILFDTASWEILQIFTVDRKIKKIAIPDELNVPLAAYCAGQERLSQENGIALLDWQHGGEEIDFKPVPPEISRCFFYDHKGELYCGGHGKLRINKEEFNHMRTEAMAISPDGSLLAAAGRGQINVYRTASFDRLESFKYTGDGTIHQILFLDNSGKNFLLAPEADANLNSKEAFILQDGRKIVIPGWTSGFNAVSGDGTMIYAVKQAKGEIEVIDAKTLQPVGTIVPASIPPKAKAERGIRAVYPMNRSGLLAVFDASGTLSLLYLPAKAKKYEKEILFAPVP